MNFERIHAYMRTVPDMGIPTAEVRVWQDHREIFRDYVGKRDGEYYWLYSASKVILCAGAMRLVERGLLKMDAPVYEYLPAWKDVLVRDGDTVRPAKRPITIRHLFSMTGGLNYNVMTEPVQAVLREYGKNATTRQITDAFARLPLDFDPYEHYQYSLCHDVLAAAMEVASGMTVGEYLKKSIFEPCGMNTISYHPTAEAIANTATQYRVNDDGRTARCEQTNHYCLSDLYESGGAGLHCRADEYILFTDALACGGVARTGERILMPETIDLMRANQLTPNLVREFNEKTYCKEGYGYGCGVRTRLDLPTPQKSHAGEFGWDGAAGAYALIDPERRLSMFYAQHVLGCKIAYGPVHNTLRDLLYE